MLVPLKDDWMSPLKSSEDECVVQLFYHPQEDKEPAEYKAYYSATLKTKWNLLNSEIQKMLKTSELGKFGISIGVVKKAFEVPSLEPIDSFFKSETSYIKGSKIMVVVISSFVECKNLFLLKISLYLFVLLVTLNYKGRILFTKGVPSIPKDLLLRKIGMIISSGKEEEPIEKPTRRLLKALFSGGIPSKLFTKHPELLIKNAANSNIDYFKESDFHKCVLNLNLLDDETINYQQLLKQPLESLKDHLLSSSNEATLRSLFWDPLLNILFLYGQEDSSKKYRISSEWKTRKLLPHLEDRKIDFEVSIKPGSKRQPILLVEAGTEPFDSVNVHKDFSKLISILSLSCISMARELLELKNTPENARSYGIWIGELKFQFCVAHPVLSRLENGKYEIHSEVTYEDYWFFDILSAATITNPQAVNLNEPADSIKPGQLAETGYKFSDLNLNEETSEIISNLLEIKKPVTEAATTPAQSKPPQKDEEVTLLNGNINFESIKKFHCFIEIIKLQIETIMNGTVNPDETRQLDKENNFGYIDSARPSTTTDTPSGSQLSKTTALKRKEFSDAVRDVSKLGHKITKRSFKELEILRKLALFSDFFAVMFSAEIKEEEGEIDYEFEKLIHIINPFSRNIVDELYAPHPFDSLVYCIKFGVQTLMGLHILHDHLRIVHSDISVMNIMYSYKDDCWKIIDFDQSMEVGKSLEISRTAGTDGFISPESKQTGIFTPKSDIYSLGIVINEYLNSILIHQILLDETGLVDSQMREIFAGFNRVVFAMISVDSDKRPSAIEALDKMFELFSDFEYDELDSKYLAIKNTLILNKGYQKSLSTEKKESDFEHDINIAKKLKITTEEREPKMPSLNVIIQKNS